MRSLGGCGREGEEPSTFHESFIRCVYSRGPDGGNLIETSGLSNQLWTNTDKTLLCTMRSRKNKGAVTKLIVKMNFARPHHVSLAKKKSDKLPGEQKDADAKGTSALLSQIAGDGVATKCMKAAKTPKRRQKKGTTSTEKEPRLKNNLGKTKKNEGCLTDAQFEEIFQSVLRKALQESLENSGKKAFPAELTEEGGPRRETLEVSLATKEGVSKNKSEENSKAVLLGAEKDHELKMKKHSKLSASKNRKGKDVRPGADNGGCKEKRKAALKKKVQGNARVIIDPEEMQQEQKADGGGSSGKWCIAWAQCSYPNCEKWRRLRNDIDPMLLPEDWSCSQNPDLQYNSCSIPEETCSGSEDEVVYSLYFPGSLVWAKQYGHPWWPGIIEADPNFGDYLLFSSQRHMLPSEYHVTFFGNSVTQAWVSASMLRSFGEASMERSSLAKLKRKGDKRKFKTALKMAKEAQQINIKERIRMFGFHSRFSERASPQNEQDHITIVCKSSAKKRAQGSGGEKKKPATPNKSQEQLLPGRPVMKPDVNGKKKIKTKRDKNLATEDLPPLSKKSRREVPCPKAEGSSKAKRQKNGQKGLRKSTVSQRKSKKAKCLSSCTENSTTDLALSSYPSKKDRLEMAKIFLMAESKDTGGLEEPCESMAFDQDGEEAFSSQEMDCPNDFSLALFED
ncbi:zinc finger CW-type PWWP domain protein 1 isoform X3 [Sceloporus undulatus]|uniref:zinc finger CW-type PWWP domain protein 1 isoform X3 n=1 Tax=Sceloporus undulatus TaxID=8520 RepID=UPI001C4CB219|nr:zinc finger CW-type PWWP domain protein 1 isoform X3 [Sceloporus undulatus]